jgi:hypothetical protein
MKISSLKSGYADMNGGAWVGDIPLPLFEGISLKVTRLWTPAYSALHDELSAENSDLSEAANTRRVTDECLVQTVLLDWKGIDDPFSADTARQVLADADVGGPFRSAIIYAATHVADAVKAQLEADEKN